MSKLEKGTPETEASKLPPPTAITNTKSQVRQASKRLIAPICEKFVLTELEEFVGSVVYITYIDRTFLNLEVEKEGILESLWVDHIKVGDEIFPFSMITSIQDAEGNTIYQNN